MLDYKRLEANALLREAGWTPSRKGLLEKHLSHLDWRYPPQVPINGIFESARGIIDALDGICIPNQCAGLGVGTSCMAIEFDFFHYDASISSKLEVVCRQIGRRAVYIGPGYNILGDWLVDETGAIYFENNLRKTLACFSPNIYQFFENDIFNSPV